MSVNKCAHLSWLVQLSGQHVLDREVAAGDVELKRRKMKGLMAELETIDTPMMALADNNVDITLHLKYGDHLHNTTPGHGAPGVSEDLLPDELIHHVGQVGDHKDGHHGQWQIGDFLLGSWEVVPIPALW